MSAIKEIMFKVSSLFERNRRQTVCLCCTNKNKNKEKKKPQFSLHYLFDSRFFLFFFPPDLWRPILLRPGISLVKTPHSQHGCADCVSHLYCLHLLLRGPRRSHGGASQPEPRHLFRHSTDALCVHRSGSMAGARCKSKKINK